MSSNVAELAADVYGVRLGVIDIMKSPTAQQRARVERMYHQWFAEKSLEDLVYWPRDEIPDEMVGALSRIIAAQLCGNKMPIPTEPDENGQPMDIGTKGLRMMQRLLAQPATGLPVMATYY